MTSWGGVASGVTCQFPPDLLLNHTLAWVRRSGPRKDVNMGGIPVRLAVGR